MQIPPTLHQGLPWCPTYKWATVCTQPRPCGVVLRSGGGKCQDKETAPKCHCLQFLDSCSCQLCGTQLLGVGLPPGLGLVERAAKLEKKVKDHPNGKVSGGGSGRQGEGWPQWGWKPQAWQRWHQGPRSIMAGSELQCEHPPDPLSRARAGHTGPLMST